MGVGVLTVVLDVEALVVVGVLLELAGCEEDDEQEEGFRWESRELSKGRAARYGAGEKENIQIRPNIATGNPFHISITNVENDQK